MKQQSVLNDETGLIFQSLNVNELRGALSEIFKLRSSDITGNVHSLFIFAYSKFSKRASKVHDNEHFA